MINNASKQDEAALGLYGMKLGTAFQLVDDVLDLSGEPDKIGKNLGDDLSEGKPTLPLLYAMQHSASADAAIVRQAIQKGGLNELPAVLAAVKTTNACEYVLRLAKTESDAGCAAIAHLPDSAYKKALINLAAFAVERSY